MPPTPDQVTLLRDVRLVVFDFDGVMTNNQVLVLQDGSEGVLCNRSDGLGVGMLKKAGLDVCVLSMEENPVVKRRCEKLKIPCIQGQAHKLPVFQKLLADRAVARAQSVYVGNDVNDLDCLEHAGLGIAVADAHESVLARVRLVTRQSGGLGAVREVCDMILAAKGIAPAW